MMKLRGPKIFIHESRALETIVLCVLLEIHTTYSETYMSIHQSSSKGIAIYSQSLLPFATVHKQLRNIMIMQMQ